MKSILTLLLLTFINQAAWAQATPRKEAQPAPPQATAKRSSLRWSAGIGMNLMSPRLKFDDVKTSTAPGVDMSAEFHFGNSASIEIQALKTNPNQFGFQAGVLYMLPAKIQETKVVFNGTSTANSSNDGSLQITNLFGGGNYRWERSYISLGLHASKFAWDTGGFTGTFDADDAFGYQVGFGVITTENLIFDATAWISKPNLTTRSSSGSETDYGAGNLSYVTVNLKYLF